MATRFRKRKYLNNSKETLGTTEGRLRETDVYLK